MMRKLTIALAAIIVAAPSKAQDGSEVATQRTVEGAQLFLSSVSAGGGTQADFGIWYNHSDFVRGGPSIAGRTWGALRGDIISLTWPSRCKGILKFKNPVIDSHQMGIANQPFPLAGSVVEQPVDWDRVAEVTVKPEERGDGTGNRVQSGWWQVSLLYVDRNSIVFFYPTKGQVERVAFAMEFLRENCAVKSDNGF